MLQKSNTIEEEGLRRQVNQVAALLAPDAT
jgi:hypothetical protein